MRTKNIITDTISLLFIFLWGYTALNKLTDFQNFKVQLGKSPLLTDIATPVAILVPVTELILAVILLIGLSKPKFKRIGLLLSTGLMVAFTTYLVIILNFSYYIPCSCGGIFGEGLIINGKLIIQKLSWREHIVFNLVFIIMGIGGTWLANIKPRINPLFEHFHNPAV